MFLPRKPRKINAGVKHKNKPENPDPEKYIVFWSKHGWIVRRRRGTVKKAELNDAFKKNATDPCSTAAKEILRVLSPYTKNISGQKLAYLAACLRKSKQQDGRITYIPCIGHEINYEFPLQNIYAGGYSIREEKDMLYIDLPVYEGCMRRNNRSVTGFYFEFILIKGDAGIPDSMRSESDRSETYSCKSKEISTCTLSLMMPENMPYLAVLKFGCMEQERFEAPHARQYGLKVVGVG